MTTLKEPFTLSGVGLHFGMITQVRLLPAEVGEGRYFVRVDLPEQPAIAAVAESVNRTVLSTELRQGTATVSTVEHLLAALVGCGIDNARIEINGPEVPLLDGSAKNWVEAIIRAGILPSPPLFFIPSIPQIKEPIWINDEDAFVAVVPASQTCFTYGIDFPYAAIANQWYSWYQEREAFTEAIAPARTFGFADQVEQLRASGLIKGGSLENALVCDHQGWLNGPLRFENEPVRHKLLDLLGDLSLLGTIPQGHYLAYKASHKLHVQLVKAIETRR